MGFGCTALALINVSTYGQRTNLPSPPFVLTSRVRPHSDVTVSTSCEPGIHTGTESSLALLAISAASIGHIEWHDHPVPLFEQRDALTEVFYYTHILVPEGDSRLSRCAALVHVQI